MISLNVIWPFLLAGAMCIFFGLAGYHVRDLRAQNEAAIAKAAFEKTISEANKAYANQKVIDDKELEALRQQATTAPPNPTIAIKKDTAKRIGAIK